MNNNLHLTDETPENKKNEIAEKLAKAIVDFLAQTGVRYRHYLDEANAKARAEAQQYSVAAMAVNNLPYYELYTEIMKDAINNTADATHLLTVDHLHQITCRNWLKRLPNGLWGFQFRGRYLRGHGQTSADITRILQRELDELCDIRGCDRLHIRVQMENDGRLVIRAAYAADMMRLRAQKIKEVI